MTRERFWLLLLAVGNIIVWGFTGVVEAMILACTALVMSELDGKS